MNVQAQAPLDDEPGANGHMPDQARSYSRQSSGSSAFPMKEAAAGFKGAFKKMANGIAGTVNAELICQAALPMVSRLALLSMHMLPSTSLGVMQAS